MIDAKRVIAATAFVLASHAVVTPASAGDSTAWLFEDGRWTPLATFANEDACGRAVQTLTEKSGARLRCTPATGERSAPASTPDAVSSDTLVRQMERPGSTGD